MSQQYQFEQIYNAHYSSVYRLCKGYFNGDEAMASDATQEVFIKVWQHLPGFRHDANLGTWIYRIAVNTCLLQLRKPVSKKEIRTDRLPDVAAEAYNPAQEERLQKMYACIQQLDAANRIVVLMMLEQVAYEQIAEVVGISADTLRVRIHRIKKQLATCVQL
ncbi:RNA polymerase sigma factor [Phnomibacter sp. MR]|uniref:RNA polymerase sigma factor n=1 Tax=Phnomibacter sp. MR TaxID=3042318 RepID=UPI003A7FDEF2